MLQTTARLASSLEQAIRRYPQQWVMFQSCGRAWQHGQHGDPSFPYAKRMKIALVYDYPFPGG